MNAIRRWTGLGVAVLVVVAAAGWPCEAQAAKKWRLYTDCTLKENASNDGDSFHVDIGSLKSASAKHKLMRLYFVDTPESEGSLTERLEEQRAYWGLPNEAAVIRCGEKAKKFTADFLKDGFIIHTRLSDALGRSRKDRDYAMIMVGKDDLGYMLVRNGLARVFGMTTDLEELDEYGRDAEAWQRRLRQAETDAKREGLGCWGMAAGAGGSRLTLPGLAPTAGRALPGAAPASVATRPALPPPVPVARPPVAPRPPVTPEDGSLAAATEARLGALTAPRAVAAQEVTLSRPVYIYPLDPPNAPRPIGQLRAGATLSVVEGISPTRAHVRFTTSGGTTYNGSANFSDLGL